MRRLGIAIVVQNIDTTGGMERQALQLGNRLAQRGARVWIVSTLQVPGAVPRLPTGVRAIERRGRLTIYRIPMCTSWEWRSCLSLYEVATAYVVALHAPLLDAIYAVHWTAAL